MEGTVERGDARGRRLGFPTANITVPDEEIRDGVWAGTVCLRSKGKDETYAAAVSIGRRPTYYRKGTPLLEAHLLDYTGDLYGRNIEVTLYAHIRAQRRFRGPDELATQIRGDVVRVRSWSAGALQSIIVKDRTGERAAPRGIQQTPNRACYFGAPAPGPAALPRQRPKATRRPTGQCLLIRSSGASSSTRWWKSDMTAGSSEPA
ncbi:riboflavin kinase [Pseudarthrobacter scleromae]|uniref:riboflavin kinase n=1 Tax=Pseudarthrobacter scleromae TaxID=158897 RepID=UPI003641F29B